jgi:hypothetical protein
MKRQMSRRALLAGAGASAGALGVAAIAPAAGAAPGPHDGEFTPFAPTAAPALGPAAPTPPLTPGLTYDILDPTEFATGTPGSFRFVAVGGVHPDIQFGALNVPVRLPVGATLKELTISYVNPAGALTFVLNKFTVGVGVGYAQVDPKLDMPPGAGARTATLNTSEPTTDGSTSYMAFVQFSALGQFVQGLLVGYISPPRAFVALNPIPRMLDTRTGTLGKLNPSEERLVTLTGVPGFATAAVINLTVTETESAGYVSVFPANVPWPGNSGINWSDSGQNLANSVVTAVDPTGTIAIHGGVARTHVVIDVQGYLL